MSCRHFVIPVFSFGLGVSVAVAGPPPVIGGENVPAGMWPDAAAIMYQGQQLCSGTLVAPTVVLTAGHCSDPSEVQTPPDHVLVGTNSLARPDDGETIAVKSLVRFPDWQDSVDMTVLVLATPAKEPPRAIATGWARLDIQNAATVNFVGYGAIDKDAMTYIDDLQQATSTITDFDCSTSSGCTAGAMPAGELGAGGMGIDTCPGDSGGPMYLPTSYGTFLAGVTSRGYATDQFPCSEGGIYERPDHVIDFIETSAGVPVTHGPEPTTDMPLEAAKGDGVEVAVVANDPKSTSHTLAVKTQPAHGTAAVKDGRLRVCVGSDAPAGTDAVTVTVTDTVDATRAVDQTFPIAVDDATGGTTACDVEAFDGGDGGGGGCCDAGRGAGGSIPLALGVALLLVRRRR